MIKLSAEERQIIKDYEKYIRNTGGNDIVELVERDGVTLLNNSIVAILQTAVSAQIALLRDLKNDGLLSPPKPLVARICKDADCELCKPKKIQRSCHTCIYSCMNNKSGKTCSRKCEYYSKWKAIKK